MYGIFTYIYHKNQPNVDPCTVNIPYMDGVGEVVVESLEFFVLNLWGSFSNVPSPKRPRTSTSWRTQYTSRVVCQRFNGWIVFKEPKKESWQRKNHVEADFGFQDSSRLRRLQHTNNWSCQLSNEKNPGWLGYIGDYTIQLYRDFNKPL